MSTTTSSRNTPSIDPVHVSPRLKPPPQTYHSSPKPLPHARAESDAPTALFDPFLAQYIRPSSNDHHELYFRLLNRQIRIKSFDYYQQYLNQEAAPVEVRVDRRKPPSPLLKETHREIPLGVLKLPITAAVESHTESRRRSASEPVRVDAPVKKAHPKVETRVLPLEFMHCGIEDLIALISRMLHLLIGLNDRSVPMAVSQPGADDALTAEQKKKLLTRYHLRTPPAISIETYLGRLTKFNNFTQATLLTTIYYIDLLLHNFQPYFTLNSWTVHRFLLVATMLAQKSLEDFFYTNDHYAKVGGVALSELNCLELDFLNRVDWKLVPAKQLPDNTTSIRYFREVLDLYYRQLVSLMGSNSDELTRVVYTLDEGPGRSDASRL